MPMCLPMTASLRSLSDPYALSMGRRSAGAALEMSVRTTGAGSDECDGMVSNIFGRRTKSAGRLMGLVPPPGGLNEAIELLAEASKHKVRYAESLRKAAAALDAHARHSNNAAVADVGAHQADLLKMEAAQATKSARDRRFYIEELRKINEAEKSVREAAMRLESLKEKRTKVVAALQKGPGILRRRSENDELRKRQQLEEVTMHIEAAEIRLDDTRREAEIIKMFRYRTGMQGIADSVISYASTTAAIFGCFREITEMVPAISTQDVMTMNYDGASITQNCVSRLRRDIAASAAVSPHSQLMGAASRRRSDNHRHGGRGSGGYPAAPALTPPSGHGGPSTPPPPYTPTAPTMSELPQPGSGGTATVPETSSTPAARASPPRFANLSLYPKLPGNPYRRSGGLHS